MSIYKEIVQNSIINTSTSKQMFSFGHEQRFNKYNKSLNDKFYEIPTTKSMRSTGFGYGNKFDLSIPGKKRNVPAPNHYQMKSMFESAYNNGKTFGISREKVKSNSIFQFSNKFPGPGTYQNKSTLSDIQYTMRVQTKDGFLSKINKFAPGPGAYDKLDAFSKSGKFPSSKFKTYGIPIINPDHKSQPSGNKVPGPGTYDPKQDMMDKILTKNNTNSGFCFTKLMRGKNLKSLITPGPGSYRARSEFGYYETPTKVLIYKK